MTATCDDRRVLRTKRTLRRALSELMVENHGIENVTVGQITERADLNRGTFYAHYADKNDLLHKSEDEFLEQVSNMQQGLKKVTLEDALAAVLHGEPLPFAVSLYDFLRANGDFISAVLGPYGDASFQVRLRDTVSTYLVESMLTPSYRENMAPLTEYYIAYYASAQLGVIQHWLARGMKESSEEMARMVLSIMFLQPGDKIAEQSGRFEQPESSEESGRGENSERSEAGDHSSDAAEHAAPDAPDAACAGRQRAAEPAAV